MQRVFRQGRIGTGLIRLVSLMALVALIGGMIAACGEAESFDGRGSGAQQDPTPTQQPATPTPAPTLIDHPMGDRDLVLLIEHQGGFVPFEYHLRRLPLVALYGDGCLITEGPQIEIYPAPALPNLLVTCLTEDGVQKILEAARDAGLLDGNADYDNDMIADAATTVFKVNADGKQMTVSAYALSEVEYSDEMLTEEQVAARKQLYDFMMKMTDLRSWLDADDFVSIEQPYDYDRLQVAAVPVTSSVAPQLDPELQAQELDWPLDTPLAELGEPYWFTEEGMTCFVVEGEDLNTLLEQLESANQLTHWSSGDEEYILIVRPLLPHEESCQEPVII